MVQQAQTRIAIAEARGLAETALSTHGFSAGEAAIIAGQAIDCELRGLPEGGLSRVLSIIETSEKLGKRPRPLRIDRETPVSALIDGGDTLGYLVADRAVRLACEKARRSGVGIVGASNTWYTGMYAHYLEAVASEGLVAMCCGSSAPRVAPAGSFEGRFGTNPIAFAIPTADDPVVLDLSTSAVIVADAVIAARTGQCLPDGVAWDADGAPTVDPVAALSGAFAVWGGHRGSGLALIVQLLGILCGGGAMPEDYRDCGFLVIVFRPDLFMDEAEFRAKASAYARSVRAAAPLDPGKPVRMPFDRSLAARLAALSAGTLSINDAVLAAVRERAGCPQEA